MTGASLSLEKADSTAKQSLLQVASCNLPVHAGHEGCEETLPGGGGGGSRSFLAPEVEEKLAKSRPSVLKFLSSKAGYLLQVALLMGYVLLETCGGLVLEKVLRSNPSMKVKPLPSSLAVMNSGLSILIGVVFNFCGSDTASAKMPTRSTIAAKLRSVFDLQAVIKASLVAALFTISNVFSMLVFSKLDADVKRILEQLKLPVSASLSYWIVGRRYSKQEWCLLIIVLLAVVNFYSAKVELDEITELRTKCKHPSYCFEEPSPYDFCALRVDGPTVVGKAVGNNSTNHEIFEFPIKATENDYSGLVFGVMAVICNSLGSLLSEKIMKEQKDKPFPTQKAQMEMSGFPIGILMSFIVPLYLDSRGGSGIWWQRTEAPGSGLGFFQGYTPMTCMAIAIDIALAWSGGIIVKQFSSVVKIVCKCFVLFLTVFLRGMLLKPCQADPLPLTMYSLACIIGAATFLFSSIPSSKKPDAASPPALPTSARDVFVASQQVSEVEMQPTEKPHESA